MYVVSVGKSWKHRGKYIKHRDNTKKHWRIMYWEQDYDDIWKLRSKFVSPLEALMLSLVLFDNLLTFSSKVLVCCLIFKNDSNTHK